MGEWSYRLLMGSSSPTDQAALPLSPYRLSVRYPDHIGPGQPTVFRPQQTPCLVDYQNTAHRGPFQLLTSAELVKTRTKSPKRLK